MGVDAQAKYSEETVAKNQKPNKNRATGADPERGSVGVQLAGYQQEQQQNESGEQIPAAEMPAQDDVGNVSVKKRRARGPRKRGKKEQQGGTQEEVAPEDPD